MGRLDDFKAENAFQNVNRNQPDPPRKQVDRPRDFQQSEPRDQVPQPRDFNSVFEERPPLQNQPRDFEQVERGRVQVENPRDFEQTEPREDVQRPQDFGQTEPNRQQVNEPRDFDGTEPRDDVQAPRDFDQTYGNRRSVESQRLFEQVAENRVQVEAPRDFAGEADNRVGVDQPRDFEQTFANRPTFFEIPFNRRFEETFQQIADERFEVEAPREFDQTEQHDEIGKPPEFPVLAIDREFVPDQKLFQQVADERFEVEAPRDFIQEFLNRPTFFEIPLNRRFEETFQQVADERFEVEAPREFEQTEARGEIDQPRLFDQTLDNRPEPEVSERRSGDLEEQRQEAFQETLDNWNSAKGPYDRPYVTTRPDSDRLNIPSGTHTIPGRKWAEHEVRLGKFLTSPKGALFNLTQGALQAQQGRQQTRIYNPGAGLVSSTSPLISVKRQFNGLDWEDEIEQVTDGEGYLRQKFPGVEGFPETTGARYRQQLRGLIASNLAESDPNKYTRVPDGPRLLQQDLQRVQQGEYDVFLGMFEYEGPDGQPRFDAYNPTAPYTSEAGGDVETADGVPNINQPGNDDRYLTLQEKNEQAREEAEEDPQQFRLGENRTPFRPLEEIPGPRATSGDNPPGPYVSDEQEAGKYHENQIETGDGEYVLHRRPDRFGQTTHGLPNHSLEDLTTDEINALPPENYDPDSAEEPVLQTENGEARQLVDFRIYDYLNRQRLVFRAYIEGLSISHNVEWSSEKYVGRPENYHIYGGASRSVDFSFKAFAESETAFEGMWQKINYLQGMVYPAFFSELRGGGAYMVAPFAQLTIGDVMRRQFGFIESLDFDLSDDYPWETRQGRQLTKGVDVSISYTIIEEDLPRTGDDFIDADFITDR